jgi:hypothetical protein
MTRAHARGGGGSLPQRLPGFQSAHRSRTPTLEVAHRVGNVSDEVVFPGLVWVKDPVNPKTGEPTGAAPRRRHHDDRGHWHRQEDNTLLGPPPYLASAAQMKTLPPCQTCAESLTGRGARSASRVGMHGSPCPSCGLALPLTGICDDCD